MDRKTLEQEKVIDNLETFYKSREEALNFLRDYTKRFLDASYKAKKDKTKEQDLKY